MSDQTQTDSGMPQPPIVLSGNELYDALMGQIEPELLSSNLPNLDALYAVDTAEQKTARAARYQNAFALYDQKLAEHKQKWDEELRTYKRHAIKYLEHRAQDDEATAIQNLESSITQ